MAEKKSKYLIWLETLHREYTDRTCITQMGRQAASLRLLAEMYEIRCRFGRILERMQKEAFQLDDEGLNYEEWYNPEKWKRGESLTADEDLRETLGIKSESPLAQTYANRLGDAYEEDAKFNTDNFRNMVSSLFIFEQIVSPGVTEVAIERELKKIQELLLDIQNAKRKTLSDEECADRFNELYESYINGFLVKPKLISEHNKWRDNLDGEYDIEEMYERRAGLLLEIFESGFADGLKHDYKRKAEDDLGFKNYEFEKWMDRMDDAVKYFAAFRKICPYENEMIDFSHSEWIGRYIIKHHIEQSVVYTFIQKMELIKMVQEDISKINPVVTKKKKTNQEQKPLKKRVTMTFGLKGSVLQGHLSILFNQLVKDEWISGNEADFKALFSMKEDEKCVLIWKAKYGKGTLVELFKRFANEELIVIPDGFTLSSILEGHFKDTSNNWLDGLDKGDSCNKKAIPFIKACVEMLKTNPRELLNIIKQGEEDLSGTYDRYDLQDLRIHKR